MALRTTQWKLRASGHLEFWSTERVEHLEYLGSSLSKRKGGVYHGHVVCIDKWGWVAYSHAFFVWDAADRLYIAALHELYDGTGHKQSFQELYRLFKKIPRRVSARQCTEAQEALVRAECRDSLEQIIQCVIKRMTPKKVTWVGL
jgi:hypothetical protein